MLKTSARGLILSANLDPDHVNESMHWFNSGARVCTYMCVCVFLFKGPISSPCPGHIEGDCMCTAGRRFAEGPGQV